MGARGIAVAASALGALALAAGCGPQEPRIEAADATVRVPLNPDVTSAYLVIENTGGADDTLTGVETEAADEVQMHESVEKDDGTTGMEERAEIPVKAGETVEFASGGLHLMLMGPEELDAGETVPLELHFAESGTVEVQAEVEDVMGEGGQDDGDMDDTGHQDMDHEDMGDMDHGDMQH
ncbi:copper chaperone PCu(A)C [Nocardiopsis baichengensis]|uniref:copper chaperone PCu(A)C n=1 Tax=Nocardiopsis baichengensis TaxID=280240 RepID=UPI000362A4D2|nr:copper chaperone PCu(A)C [Nocardiopsis baichengensis]